jgi:hypothetical protein
MDNKKFDFENEIKEDENKKSEGLENHNRGELLFSLIKDDNENVEESQEAVKKQNRILKSKRRNRPEESSGGLVSGIMKAVLYVLFVLVSSAFLSYFIISGANDVFAFVKSGETIPVAVYTDDTYKTIADRLEEKGIIEYKWLFKMFVAYQADDTSKIDFIEVQFF